MEFVSKNLELVLLISFILSVVSAVLLLFLIWRIFYLQRKTRALLSGKKGKDLEGMLNEIFDKTNLSLKEIEEIKKTLKRLTQLSEKGIQKVGVIRFNPFKETGGDLSFSLALLDYYNNGVVISSLHGREETRIYAKPIIQGKSQYHLSEEEQKALKKAIEGKN